MLLFIEEIRETALVFKKGIRGQVKKETEIARRKAHLWTLHPHLIMEWILLK